MDTVNHTAAQLTNGGPTSRQKGYWWGPTRASEPTQPPTWQVLLILPWAPLPFVSECSSH